MSGKQKRPSPNTFDAVIVGCGIIGLSIALALKQRGKKVIVIDRGTQEASWAAGGMLRPLTESESPEFLSLCLESAALYPAYVKEVERLSGMDVEYDTTGSLLFALNEQEWTELKQKHALAQQQGIASRLLDEQAAQKREPALGRVTGALFMPSDVQLNNQKLMEALNTILKNEIVVGDVKKIGEHSVETERESFTADAVIVCAGAWTDALVPLGVAPRLGEMVRCRMAKTLRHIISRHPTYLIPRKDGTLIIGSTVKDEGFEKRVSARSVEKLREDADLLVPRIKGWPLVETWAGFRPYREQGLMIGKRDGVYVAAGHFRNGILLAPVTAKIISEAICDGSSRSFGVPG